MPSTRLEHPHELADPEALAAILGPVAELRREPMEAPGFTGARFERLSLRLGDGALRKLVLKRARLDSDWTAWRTADAFGRAALPLDEPALAGIWEVYACPYVAHAVADGEVGLLMDDVGPYLLPDVRQPLEEASEDLLVDSLARLHARFWNASELDNPRLAAPARVLGMLGPRHARELGTSDGLAPVVERARRGWEFAFQHLPASIVTRLSQPPEDIVGAWGPLPRTLLHGDTKVANFAILPDGKVAAFDWGCLSAGPAAIDLGWYLAVNASRIRGPKESFVARYRQRLEAALIARLSEGSWSALVSAAVESGAMLLLWSKALALERGGASARAEWDWWVEQLAGA